MSTPTRGRSSDWAIVTRASRLLAALLVVYLALPYMQARVRPKTPPTEAMREATRHVQPCGAAATPPEPPAVPRTDRERLLVKAHSLQGAPYKWGAKGPNAFDCSGLTKAAYEAAGVRLPDGSFNQAKGERALTSLTDLAPGDLLFYRWNRADGVTHVTLYAGKGWAIGTGSPGQPPEVVVYPLASDFRVPNMVVTYRHVVLPDER